jgi:hypothetical protein
MSFDPNHVVGCPPFSVKLEMTMLSGDRYYGTGFCVTHQDCTWLVTCRHNIEDREENFLGTNDLAALDIIGESRLTFGDDRRVVGVSINGFVADCVAIELKSGEWSIAPKFGTDIVMTVKGGNLPAEITVQGPQPEDVLKLKPTGHVLFQGYPGGAPKPVTLRGVRAAPLPTVIQPWMITFLPACKKGFSGGPVLAVTDDQVSLLGITTHLFQAKFSAPMGDGRTAEVEVTASAGVPLTKLVWAMEHAALGNTIAAVPSV